MIECPKCGFRNPEGAEFCQNPSACGAFLGYVEKRIEPQPGKVLVSISNAALSAEPGSLATLEVRVRNKSNIVDQFTIDVAGEPSAWTTIQPSTLSLFPDAEGMATVQLRPPRTPGVTAGTKSFTVKVQSKAAPETSTQQQAAIQVAPFIDAAASVTPRTARGGEGAIYRVEVQNLGNAPLRAALDASDPDELLAFDFDRPAVAIGPGETATAHLQVRARSTFFDGPPQPHSFKVALSAAGLPPKFSDGTFLQEAVSRPVKRKFPVIPVALVALLLLALIAGVIERDPLMRLVAGKSSPPTNANTGGSTTGASAMASASPTPSPTPSASPTPVMLVAIPNVTCMSEQAAQQALSNVGLVYVPNFIASNAYPRGTVFKTQPLAGGMAPRGTEITALVSTGPASGQQQLISPCLLIHLQSPLQLVTPSH